MNEILQFAYLERNADIAKKIISQIEEKGYKIQEVSAELKYENALIFLIFDKNATKEEYDLKFPWLKNQLEYSSIKKFKLMPIFIYHSKVDEPESLFDGPIGEFYESIFSGEFKPYGYDLDNLNPLDEFDNVLENYLE